MSEQFNEVDKQAVGNALLQAVMEVAQEKAGTAFMDNLLEQIPPEQMTETWFLPTVELLRVMDERFPGSAEEIMNRFEHLAELDREISRQALS